MTLTLDIAMPMHASGAPMVEVKGIQASANGTSDAAPPSQPPALIEAETPAAPAQETIAVMETTSQESQPVPNGVQVAASAAPAPRPAACGDEWDNQAFKKRDQLY